MRNRYRGSTIHRRSITVPARYGTPSTPSKPFAKARSGPPTSPPRPTAFFKTSATARCRRCRGSFPTSSTPIIPAITRIPDRRGSRPSSMRSVKAPTGKRRPSSSFGTTGEVSTITSLRRFSTTRAVLGSAYRCSSSPLGLAAEARPAASSTTDSTSSAASCGSSRIPSASNASARRTCARPASGNASISSKSRGDLRRSRRNIRARTSNASRRRGNRLNTE